MNENIKDLKTKFYEIKKKGYVPAINQNNSGIGNTFEYLLGKEQDNFCWPDYNGIEIKSINSYGDRDINLFSSVPDGPDLFEIERLKNKYGYPWKKDKKYNVLLGNVYGNIKSFIGLFYQYKLEVNREKKKLYLCIYNQKGYLIEKKVYWDFDNIEKRLITKLNYLAIVDAWKTTNNSKLYYKYYKMDIYKIYSINIFFDLIEKGIIGLKICISVYSNPERYGQTHNNGEIFFIKRKNIEQLFCKLSSCR